MPFLSFSVKLFVPSNAPHTDRMGPGGAHTIGVELSPGVSERVTAQTGVFKDARVISGPALGQTGRRLYREFRSSDVASTLAMESIALEMLVLTSRVRTVGESGEPTWMATVREVLHENFTEAVGLADLARIVDVHETHLARARPESTTRGSLGGMPRSLPMGSRAAAAA